MSDVVKASRSTLGAMYIHEVARDLLVSESQVRKLIRLGELPAMRIGRRIIVFREDVLAYIEQKRKGE